MNEITNLIVIPIIASALTILISTLFTIGKEVWQEKRKTVKELRNDKLIKLYNKLYVIKIKYYDSLEIDDLFDYNGDPKEDGWYDLWNKTQNEITAVIGESIHLLEEEDLLVWEKVLRGDAAEHYYGEPYKAKYDAIIDFLSKTTDTYHKLYKDYHNINK